MVFLHAAPIAPCQLPLMLPLMWASTLAFHEIPCITRTRTCRTRRRISNLLHWMSSGSRLLSGRVSDIAASASIATSAAIGGYYATVNAIDLNEATSQKSQVNPLYDTFGHQLTLKADQEILTHLRITRRTTSNEANRSRYIHPHIYDGNDRRKPSLAYGSGLCAGAR